ncbi:MAG TPA: 23S rRNA (adenine(2503)-C(2))-methyltransferase RlmN [Methylomusa anaerophila]|uniref:Probable dual-specificity RNA methyltransferase RlmN n=1 Tax=Methylomusa anaerophila TaxID=1930071 RepID=A0A348APN4_9FIRM|nr:23S rRNA (adenine(2503)-C(2))-methyltransferase RlmN [Methylomusa anaerophila]BBB93032.1 putative dual-specificity RNA methyltransferase RlmN [Methylomusa anaerophila]HML87134.1 23S rRNA (adenine(2503)-C(2))-methyltransferase RlmN [Methylomusa anaerophila]
MVPDKSDLFGLFADEIAAKIKPLGLEKYRGQQIAEWMYLRGVNTFADMTNIPKAKRLLLDSNFIIGSVSVIAEQHSADGLTSKFLLSFADDLAVETVLMRQPYGNSVCVSSQVGCAMGCTFCASTLSGVARNLSGGEILSQVLYVNHLLAQQQEKVDSIVIMGAGEPLANYDNVLRFIRLLHEKYCLNLSYRSITLSTAGLTPEIDRLGNEGLPITLSISLHAPNNKLRSQLMPINNRYPIESLLAAADRYVNRTGRRITYEYILIKGVNDRPGHARDLARILKGKLANVNLIPVNPVPERGLLRPYASEITCFEQILQEKYINVSIRKEMGKEIDAACGQLRRKVLGD